MLILHNANIFIGGFHPQFAEAIAIHENKIVAIGKNVDVLTLAGRNSIVKDLRGKTILPGLTDSHIHLQHTAKSLSMVNCETNSVDELYNRVKVRVEETEPGKWIFGHGWNQNEWTEGFDGMQILNDITNEHPILLTAKSLHACWANNYAVKLAGINTDSSNPQGGVIGRNKDNSPNGLFFENAMELMYHAIPNLSKSELMTLLEKTQKELWKFGITAVHDFDGVDCFSALQELEKEKILKLRVVKNIPSSILDEITKTGIQTGFGSEFLRFGSVKYFSDGALGPQTAAMIEPYENDSVNCGILLLTKEEIVEHGVKATKNGLSLAIHAIGDKANREVIDAYAQIRVFERENGLAPQHHRIEHVQVLQESDLSRLAENRIIASMQPIHLISDMDTADRLWGTRSKNTYAFGTLVQKGTTLIFGSDSPVESFNPFTGIYAALTRQKLDQTPDTGWFPEQKIDLVEILKAYTINPALVSRWDAQIGSLEPGKLADLIILSKNIFSIPSNEIKDLTPEATMVNGEWVYQREEI